MSLRNLLTAGVAAFTPVAAAFAQTPTPGEQAERAFGPYPTIEISTTFRARIEGVTDPRDVPSATAQDTARRALYNLAANECRVLLEYWRADCRLISFTVRTSLPSFGGAGPEPPQFSSMFGFAVYELRPNGPNAKAQ